MTDNSSIFFEDGCLGSQCVKLDNVLVYWTASVFITVLGFIALMYISWEYFNNPGMKKPAIKLFHPILFGDALIVLNYLPYHIVNIANFAEGGSPQIRLGPGCELSFALTCLSLAYGNLGLLLVSVAPYKMLHDVKRGKVPSSLRLTKKVYVGVMLFAGVFGSFFYLLGTTTTQIGDFKGLFCSLRNWNSPAGILSVVAIILTIVIMLVLYVLTFRGIRDASLASALQDIELTLKNSPVNDQDRGIPTLVSSHHVDQIQKAAENIFKLGTVMLVSFTIATASFTITSTLNASGYDVPHEWEMASGLLLKLRPLVDCIVIYHTPVVHKGRQQRKDGTAELTNNTTAPTNRLLAQQRTQGSVDGQGGTVDATVASFIESQI